MYRSTPPSKTQIGAALRFYSPTGELPKDALELELEGMPLPAAPIEETQMNDITTPTLPDAARFILAGNAIFTVVSRRTGERFTFKVSQADEGRDGKAPPHFVGVLAGPDNTSDYTFIGTLFSDGTYRHSAKSRISSTAPSAKAAMWVMTMVRKDPAKLMEQADFHHAGRCGRCGRLLTVPSSIESGFGPECAGKMM